MGVCGRSILNPGVDRVLGYYVPEMPSWDVLYYSNSLSKGPKNSRHCDPKKVCEYFSVFPNSQSLLEIFSTNWTRQCLICLFHMDNHLDQVRSVMFVERISRQNRTSENFVKKGT